MLQKKIARKPRFKAKVKKHAAIAEKQTDGHFPIVGIGASAGGLEAFMQLLRNLPLDTGMGFVLVQHLDPVRQSALTELLAKTTRLPVREVIRDTPVEPNHVYVISPNTNLAIEQSVLKLRPRQKSGGAHHSVDFFFESLAHDQRERAIGVILSGAASDGTLGLETIKAENGITFAQDDSARYDSMPRSAVAAGCVDFVLAPEKIAKELARLAKHPYVSGRSISSENERAFVTAHQDDETPLSSGGRGTPHTGAKQARAEAEAAGDVAGEKGYKKILLLLRSHSGVDFSLYKSSTIQRRVTRRMVLNKSETLEAYAQRLRGNASELNALYSDVLISVTSFFRNPEAFEFLQRKVFPRILPTQRDEPVRVWTLGCSTGQEAYSIAMAFMEFLDRVPRAPRLQVFATDLNGALLEKARAGHYAESLVRDISPERLRRFFTEEEGGYRVCKALRDAVVFARQNLISDPPFSRMDLISCRNLLIYIEPGLQMKVLPTFHYALRPKGFLFLGAAEGIGGFTDLFEAVDRKHKIYAKKPGPSPALHPQRLAPPRPDAKRESAPRFARVPENFHAEINVQREADRIALNRYAPTGVLVDAGLQVLQFRGEPSAFLKLPTGQASFNVLKMAREGLMMPLRAAINKAKKENKTVRKENVRLEQNGRPRAVNIEVTPLKNLKERCYLIFFEIAGRDLARPDPVEPRESALRKPTASRQSRLVKKESRRITELESELAETRDYLQSLQEQQEAAHEELQASNEEVTSANEELQSTNEELETSKEELESANEELTTVNEEMANRNAELNRLNNDLLNLQTSTHLAIVLLGRDLTIRRFSVQAEKQFNLLAGDLGRPIGNVRHNLDLPDLEGFVAEVIETVREREHEVRDKAGRWYSLRVRPYMTLENKIDGAVLILVDINDLKETQRAIGSLAAIVESSNDAIVSKDLNGVITSWNKGAERLFGYTAHEAIGQPITLLIPPGRQHEEPEILERIRRGETVDHFDTVRVRKDGAQLEISLTVSPLKDSAGRIIGASKIARDISERRRSEEALRESEARNRALFEEAESARLGAEAAKVRAESATRAKDDFLAALSHELRTPLNPALLLATSLADSPELSPATRADIDVIAKSIALQVQLIDDMLDITRITTGKLRLDLRPTEVHVVLRQAYEILRADADGRQIKIILDLAAPHDCIKADGVRLQQIFWNVLKNAVKFTRPGGVITVRTRSVEGTPPVSALGKNEPEKETGGRRVHENLVIEFIDTGVGIESEMLGKIFDAFIQEEHIGTRCFGGIGLGLAITHRLVEAQGGQIHAESAGRNCGATFRIEFPLDTSESGERDRSAPDSATYALVTARHILLVEDDEKSRSTLVRLLERRGHHVTAVRTAAAAREIAAARECDLVISDLGLPDGDGHALMNELRDSFALPGIALSGYGTADDVERSQKSGFFIHLIKPIDIHALERAIAAAPQVRIDDA